MPSLFRPVRSYALRLASLALALCAISPGVEAQKFLQPTIIPTGNNPAAVYTADINKDGFPDLIYIDRGAAPNQSSTTHVLLNDGKGNFKESAAIATAGDSVGIGDFDGDGALDLEWIRTPSGVGIPGNQIGTHLYLARGHGDGTFDPPTISVTVSGGVTSGNPTGSPLYGFLTAARLYPAGPDSLICEVLGDAAGSGPRYLPTLITYRATSNPSVIATSSAVLPSNGPYVAADLNNDRIPDIILDALVQKIAVVLLTDKNGLPQPVPGVSSPGVGGIFSLLVKDVSGDGFGDLIAEGPNGHIDVFLGNADGTFETSSVGGSGALDGLSGNGGHLIALADLNHDGNLDALTSTPAGVSPLLGTGGSFKLKGIYNAGPGHTSYAVADFNGDGNLDLAVDAPNGIAILYGNADGSFQTSNAYASGKPALSLAAKVFIDKWPDVVVSIGSQQAQFLRGDGTGNFVAAPQPTNPTPGDPRAWSFIGAGDFDGDAKVDLVLTSTSLPAVTQGPGLLILLGRADGTFEPEPQLASLVPPPPIYGPATTSDLDGDGTFDTINAGPNTLFEAHYDRKIYGYVNALDISSTSPNVAIQTASGYFKTGRSLQADLVVAREPPTAGAMPTLTAYPNNLNGQVNNPGGSFSRTTPIQLPLPADVAGMIPASVQIADADGDGFGDIVALFHNPASVLDTPNAATANRLLIYWNKGDNTFSAPLEVTPSRNFYLVRVGDMDRDGKPDVVLADDSIVEISYGLGSRAFGKERDLLAGQGINDLALSDVNVDGALDIVVANGGATLSSVAALGYKPGVTSLSLTPNPDVNTGGITVLLNPAKASAILPTGTLTASPEPQPFEAAVTITATINTPAGGAVPTGMVTFTIDGKPAGTGTLVNGVATVPGPAQLLPGKHTLSAVYSGDANYLTLNLTGTHTVLLGPTTTTLTPGTPLMSFYGQPIDGTFNIVPVDVTNFPLTGTVTLYDNGVAVPICTNLPYFPGNAVGGGTNCPYGNPVLLDVGPHVFEISYNGDPINAASISNKVNYVVQQDTTTTAITASAAQVTAGQAITFKSVVVGNAASPKGPVNYLDGTTILGSGPLTATTANISVNSLTTSALTTGTHTITACYPATLDFGASCSGPVTITVVPAVAAPVASLVALTSSLNPSVFGNAVTFTAQVTSSTKGAVPTGTVVFMDGTVTIGTVTLSNAAVATITTSTLSIGIHAITATYSGDAATLSSSAVLPQAVVAPSGSGSFTLTVTPAPVTIGVGRTAVLLVTVKSINGFSQPVTLSCAGTPNESACIFIQTTIPAGGGSTTLDVTTMAPHECGDPGHPYFLGSLGGTGGVLAASLLAGFGLLAIPRKRRSGIKLLLGLVALCGLASLSGCGHCTDLGTRPGTYTFTVTGAAQGGPVSQTVSKQVEMNLVIN